jgi:site-specific recombinase XerD
MNKRRFRRTSRRLYVREQLTGYGPETDQEIPYSDQYTQFMVTERNCKPATAKCNLDMIKEFYLFLKLEYGLDRFDPLLIEPSHVRRYLVYLNNELNNSPVTRNRKLSALGSYYLFMECFEYIEEDLNPTLLIRRAKATRSLPVFLNLEEAQSILRVSSFGLYGERNLAIMRLMLQTAIRVEELVKLNRAHRANAYAAGRSRSDGIEKTGGPQNFKDNPALFGCFPKQVAGGYEKASAAVRKSKKVEM